MRLTLCGRERIQVHKEMVPTEGRIGIWGLLKAIPLGFSFLPADRMHPFLAIYDLQPLKVHPLVFAPGVPVTAQVVGTERYTSGSKVVGLILGRVGEGGLARVDWTGRPGGHDFWIFIPPGGNLYSIFCPPDSW